MAPLARRGSDIAKRGGDSNGSSSNASLSPYASGSDEESEDSENLPWGLAGRGPAAGKAAKGAASVIQEGIVGRRRDEESRKGLGNVAFGGGGGGVGDGGRAQGADAGSRGGGSGDGSEDEADEDIHARQASYAVWTCADLSHSVRCSAGLGGSPVCRDLVMVRSDILIA